MPEVAGEVGAAQCLAGAHGAGGDGLGGRAERGGDVGVRLAVDLGPPQDLARRRPAGCRTRRAARRPRRAGRTGR